MYTNTEIEQVTTPEICEKTSRGKYKDVETNVTDSSAKRYIQEKKGGSVNLMENHGVKEREKCLAEGNHNLCSYTVL